MLIAIIVVRLLMQNWVTEDNGLYQNDYVGINTSLKKWLLQSIGMIRLVKHNRPGKKVVVAVENKFPGAM
jgi:hypothetical protein